MGSVSGGLCLLRQQTRGNRLYFSSFPVPVLEDPTYVGPEGIPRVLGAEGAAVSAKKIPSWRWAALPRVGPGKPVPFLLFTFIGVGRSSQGCRPWLGREFCLFLLASPGDSPKRALHLERFRFDVWKDFLASTVIGWWGGDGGQGNLL